MAIITPFEKQIQHCLLPPFFPFPISFPSVYMHAFASKNDYSDSQHYLWWHSDYLVNTESHLPVGEQFLTNSNSHI